MLSAPTEQKNDLRDHTNFQENFDGEIDTALKDAIHAPVEKVGLRGMGSWKPSKIIGAL